MIKVLAFVVHILGKLISNFLCLYFLYSKNLYIYEYKDDISFYSRRQKESINFYIKILETRI